MYQKDLFHQKMEAQQTKLEPPYTNSKTILLLNYDFELILQHYEGIKYDIKGELLLGSEAINRDI